MKIVYKIGLLGRSWFTPLDVQKIVGSTDRNYIYVLLSRMTDDDKINRKKLKGVLVELHKRGMDALVEKTEEVLEKIVADTEQALEYHRGR